MKATERFSRPPARYTEASLVKKLEELGIGRPSTYASIISVLQDRKYVEIDKKRFHPTNLGRLVTVFLIGFFTKYVEYDFTADLETDFFPDPLFPLPPFPFPAIKIIVEAKFPPL